MYSAERKKKAPFESMFDDVYDERTPELNRQCKDWIRLRFDVILQWAARYFAGFWPFEMAK